MALCGGFKELVGHGGTKGPQHVSWFLIVVQPHHPELSQDSGSFLISPSLPSSLSLSQTSLHISKKKKNKPPKENSEGLN